jgi:hypothetical protein
VLQPSTLHLLTTTFTVAYDAQLLPPAPAKRRRLARRRAGELIR